MEIFNGIDMEKISRFEGLVKKESFLSGVYTEGERADILKSPCMKKKAACLFSLKESVSKARGRGLYGMLPKEIEVFHEENGRPFVRLRGGALERYGGVKLSVSVSYKDDYVITLCTAFME